MKSFKSAAVLGTVAQLALFQLLVVGKASSTKSSESGDKNVTVYVERAKYKAYMEKAAAAFEKKLVLKLPLKLVTNGWIGQPFTDNQSG